MKWWILFLGMAIFHNIWGVPEPFFHKITKSQGLPSNHITCIEQDHFEFIWIGTIAGLSRYDGHEYRSYLDGKQHSGRKSNHITCIMQAQKHGDLWIGTKNGLFYYNAKTDTILHKADVRDINSISLLDEDILLISSWKGLVEYNIKPEKASYISKAPSIDHLALDDSTMLIGSTNGLFAYHTTNGNLTQAGIDNTIIYSLFKDSRGQVWIGTANNGIYRYDASGRYTKVEPVKNIKNNRIECFTEDDFGNIWISVRGFGLLSYHPPSDSTTIFTPSPYEPRGLSSDIVLELFKDKYGNIWMGTYNKGICFFDNHKKPFQHFKFDFSNLGLRENYVKDVLLDAKKNLWIATPRYIHEFYPESGNFDAYRFSSSKADINTLAQLNKQELLLGTIGNGVQIFNIDEKKFYQNEAISEYIAGNSNIYRIYKDDDNRLWISVKRKGVFVFDEQLKLLRHFGKRPQSSPHLGNVRTIRQDDDGFVWLGSYAGGIFLIDPHLTLTNNFVKNDDQYALSNNDINFITQATNGNILIGTRGGGLNQYNKMDSSFTVYSTDEGLNNNYVWGILEDNMGNIWVSTSNSISKITRDGTIENYTINGKLPVSDFNLGTCGKTADGKLIFGGTSGFSLFDPDLIKPTKIQPKVYITGLNIFDHRIKPTRSEVLPKQTMMTDQIVLKQSQSVFSLEFAALNFPHSNHTKYAYQLTKAASKVSEWNYTQGAHRQVTYSSLSPGEYTFTVRATNADGKWSNHEATLKIIILPPWWKSIPAYIFYALLIGSILYLVHSFFLRRVKLLNELKFERLQHKKDLEINKLKLDLFANISHEVKTPLSLIKAPLEKLEKDLKNGDSKSRNYIKLVKRSTNQLTRLVSQLLDYSKLDAGLLKLEPKIGDIVSFIKDITETFQPLSDEHQIRFEFTADKEQEYCVFDPDKLEKVIYNLLFNAFKFTPDQGRIDVILEVFDKEVNTIPERGSSAESTRYVKLIVEDTGVGIEPDKLPHIFERFYQSNYNNSSGTGIGLALVKELVELHFGHISVVSKPGEGTTFEIIMPVDQAFYHSKGLIRLTEYTPNINGLRKHEAANTPERTDDQGQKPLILVVEDNHDLRSFIRQSLEETYNVMVAADGEKGLSIAARKMPDLIISDIMMPRKDGLTLCTELKQDISTSHIPVILLTARSSETHQYHGLETGADDYITKPFSLHILQKKVENLVQHQQALRDKWSKDMMLAPKEVTVTSLDDAFLKQLMEYVESNIDRQELNPNEMAKELGMSRSQIYRKLKVLTGQSVQEFVRHIRLKRAAQLMEQDPGMNIAQIAFAVGFQDPKYFSKAFSKYYGMPPSRYVQVRSQN